MSTSEALAKAEREIADLDRRVVSLRHEMERIRQKIFADRELCDQIIVDALVDVYLTLEEKSLETMIGTIRSAGLAPSVMLRMLNTLDRQWNTED